MSQKKAAAIKKVRRALVRISKKHGYPPGPAVLTVAEQLVEVLIDLKLLKVKR